MAVGLGYFVRKSQALAHGSSWTLMVYRSGRIEATLRINGQRAGDVLMFNTWGEWLDTCHPSIWVRVFVSAEGN